MRVRARGGALLAVGLVAGLVGVRDALPQEAPTVLQGRVIDRTTQTPLEAAFVAFEGDSRGVFTDAGGLFRLPGGPAGERRVAIEVLGYGVTLVAGERLEASPPVVLALRADPILLEGVAVVADRFQRRRNAAAVSVRAFDSEQLRASNASDALEYLEMRTFVREAPCPTLLSGGCARIRGRTQRVIVCIDEVPALGGLYQLRAIQPHQLHLVEVYASGQMVRVYTKAFMAQAARVRLNPTPLEFGC